MKITRDYNADTLVDKVSSLVDGIASLETKYNNSITNLNNSTNKINFANAWDDPVQDAVETYVESLKNDTQTIDSDISSGNFQNLKRKLNELLSEAETFQANKIKLKEREEKLQAERNKDKDDRDDSVIASLNSAVNSSKSMIDRNVERINTLLKDISNIEFNKEYHELELPNVMIEPVNIEEPVETPDDSNNDNEDQEETPVAASSYNRSYTQGNLTITYSTDEYGNPVCTVVEHTARGDSTTVYSVDSQGYMLLNGSKHQDPNSALWSDQFSFIYVTVKDGDKTTTIPVLTNANMPDGLMFDGDTSCLDEYGINKDDYHYGYEYSLGTEFETNDGKTVVVDTSPPSK